MRYYYRIHVYQMWMIAIEILEVEQMLISWTCGTTVEHGAKYIDAHR